MANVRSGGWYVVLLRDKSPVSGWTSEEELLGAREVGRLGEEEEELASGGHWKCFLLLFTTASNSTVSGNLGNYILIIFR